MKTKINTALLRLLFALLPLTLAYPLTASADNDKVEPVLNTVFVAAKLAPVIPAVADFNDNPNLNSAIYTTLLPVAANEATFEDSGSDAILNWKLMDSIKPVLPAEAAFEK